MSKNNHFRRNVDALILKLLHENGPSTAKTITKAICGSNDIQRSEIRVRYHIGKLLGEELISKIESTYKVTDKSKYWKTSTVKNTETGEEIIGTVLILNQNDVRFFTSFK